jgi:hypothetical protein
MKKINKLTRIIGVMLAVGLVGITAVTGYAATANARVFPERISGYGDATPPVGYEDYKLAKFDYSDFKINSIGVAGDKKLKVTWCLSDTSGVAEKCYPNRDNPYEKWVVVLEGDGANKRVTLGKDVREHTFQVNQASSYAIIVYGLKTNKKYDVRCGTNKDFMLKQIRNKVPFVDINSASGKENIIKIYQYGITEGSPAGSNTYKPTDTVNRGAMAQFLRRAVGNPKIVNKVPTFTDLGTGIEGRDDAIKWLASEGITKGSPKGSDTYRPQDVVTRGAMAEFLYKLAGSPCAINPDPNSSEHHQTGEGDCDSRITEADWISGYPNDKDLLALKKTNPNRYYDIYWLYTQHIAYGIPIDGNWYNALYNPNAPVTRNAMGTFIANFLWLKGIRPD